MTGATDRIAARFAGRVGNFSLDAHFEAPMRGVTALFGPSGCGKTTVLRCMAGLQRLNGRLDVADDVWQDSAQNIYRPPYARPVGYVFQEASLFAHLSVRANLLFGHRRALRAGGREEIRLDDVVDLLGLATLLDRAPANLSGGERQRVAVGRALLSQPRLLLMDEPLSALDRFTKEEILPYFEALHAGLSIPVMYVSHDITEIERLADTLVLLDQGRVLAAGPYADLAGDPTLPLLRAPDAAVTVEGTVTGIDAPYSLTSFALAGGVLIIPGLHGAAGARHRLRISTSDVSFTRSPPTDTTILNCLPARVISVAPQDETGIQMNIVALLGRQEPGAHIVGRVTRKSQEQLGLKPGVDVYAQIKSVSLIAYGTQTRLAPAV